MKYRKKPVVVDAVQWTADCRLSEVTDWIHESMNKNPGEVGNAFRLGDKIQVFTLEGMMLASPGDYIIRGINGELYPCKPDIFEKTYEAV